MGRGVYFEVSDKKYWQIPRATPECKSAPKTTPHPSTQFGQNLFLPFWVMLIKQKQKNTTKKLHIVEWQWNEKQLSHTLTATVLQKQREHEGSLTIFCLPFNDCHYQYKLWCSCDTSGSQSWSTVSYCAHKSAVTLWQTYYVLLLWQ